MIPEEWEAPRLGEAADVLMGQSPSGASYNRSGIGVPLINGPTEFTEKHPIKIQWTSEPTKYCRKGDVLLCVRGSSTGRMNISDDEYCIGRGVAAIRAKTGADTPFITYQVASAVQGILALTTGSTFPSIDGKSIRAIQISLPPLPEQRAIAGALSDVDALIGSLEHLIAKKRDLKQATMQQLLTGQTRLPGFHGKWEVRSLHEVCQKIQDGTHFSPKLGGNDYLYVTSKNIGFGKFDVSTADRIDAAEHAKIYARCDVKKGDLLLTKDGANTGNAALNPLDEPFSLLSSVALLRFDCRRHLPAYFLYQILSFDGQRQIKDLMSGNAITRVTLVKIRSLRFSIASLEEQTAIAEVLSDMDAELAALEQRRDKTLAFKQGMMQELLTGRTRLV